ncbi:MAG TPA: transglutaminase-like domain-containing protein [Propionibacteriaceae bacterium]|nr:transglutaminase-like domain-containing protein [Propionibacteriaceae bacterium]
MPTVSTHVLAHIEAQVTETAEMVFSVAVAHGPALSHETLTITLDGQALPVEELVVNDGGRLHIARDVPPGALVLDYEAGVDLTRTAPLVTAIEAVTYVRPSRYCESDALGASANRLFGGLDGQELVDAVVGWVAGQTQYLPGASGPTDGAIDTLLAGQGVCRDYAHLVTALLRARGVPARTASVYAPGLSPMDFHAVVEVALDGLWQLVDATRLAPRGSMVRIATGRDAADTAFLTVHSGAVALEGLLVTCVALPDLPADDQISPFHL